VSDASGPLRRAVGTTCDINKRSTVDRRSECLGETEFEVEGDEVIHKPTSASTMAYQGRPEPYLYRQSTLGTCPNGDDYREHEVTHVALRLLRERLDK
jgi:hypothetical protein